MAFDGHSFGAPADSSINFCSLIDFSHQLKLLDNSIFKKPLYNRAFINHHTFAKEIMKVTLFPTSLYYHFISRTPSICSYKQVSY